MTVLAPSIDVAAERERVVRRRWIEWRARRALGVAGPFATEAAIEQAVTLDPRVKQKDRRAVKARALELQAAEGGRRIDPQEVEATMARVATDRETREKIREYVREIRRKGELGQSAAWRHVMDVFGIHLTLQAFRTGYWFPAYPGAPATKEAAVQQAEWKSVPPGELGTTERPAEPITISGTVSLDELPPPRVRLPEEARLDLVLPTGELRVAFREDGHCHLLADLQTTSRALVDEVVAALLRSLHTREESRVA